MSPAQLVAGPWENDWRLGVQVQQLLGQLLAQGRPRRAVEVCATQARLALARGAVRTAALAVDVARAQVPGLAADHGATALVAELAAAVEAAPEVTVDMPADVEEAHDHIMASLAEDGVDAERALDMVVVATERWPDDRRLVRIRADLEQRLQRPEQAVLVLRESFDRAAPDDPDAGLELGFALLAAQQTDAFERHADAMAAAGDSSNAEWLRAVRALQAGNHATAVEHGLRVTRAEPGARNARRLVAEAGLEAGLWAEVLEVTAELSVLEPDDQAAPWLSLTAATAVGDWRLVRDRARAAGVLSAGPTDVEAPGDETAPIDEAWGLIEVVHESRDEPVVALRTGPATARVLEVTAPHLPQLAGELVLLAPDPVSVPAEGAEDERMVMRVLVVLEPATTWTVELDGLDPGIDRWNELREALGERSWHVSRRSGDDYLVGSRKKRTGIYVWLAVPGAVDAVEAHRTLTEVTAGWGELFVVWPELARAAGDEAAESAHRRLADKHRIVLG